ncbi:MAG: flavodoxin family protein [Spirochaetes bacterium]|nr:flavodoxin family protein [Spirochaetota bacterium]
MKTLIIYVSYHHKNTEKISRYMGKVLKARVVDHREIKPRDVIKYDLIGFGAGIYYWKHHKYLIDFVDQVPKVKNKKAFIFSTRGIGPLWYYHRVLRRQLKTRNFKVVHDFSFKCWDTAGPFRVFGGLNKGRPDKRDFKRAGEIAKEIIKRVQ